METDLSVGSWSRKHFLFYIPSIPPWKRGRRPLNREIDLPLEDSQVLISMGMSPLCLGKTRYTTKTVHELSLDGPLRTESQVAKYSTDLASPIPIQRRSFPSNGSFNTIVKEHSDRRSRRARLDPYPNAIRPHPASPVMPLRVQHLNRSHPMNITMANDNDFTPRGILYGPIGNEKDHEISVPIVKEVLDSLKLSPTIVQSVRPVPGRAEFVEIEFLKDEDALNFVELVGAGLDGHPSRHASFANRRLCRCHAQGDK
ncbi:hypothetical protein CPB84DRAFT_1751409 [Gymnopilus junonius]|uniref:Uncharacterized protein n=1 Tax=Gymnopilus junonius TaxID=109634 RepID=A0A9P5TI49_GYMJU|nr:hypothetical protein CPB84DRAFT_1751409 [Gymnopilus junonius]